MGYWQPGRGWQTSRNYPIAGEYRAIALDLQGISQQQAQALQADLEATQQKLTNEDFTSLTKQQLVGDLLYSTIHGYFVLNNVQDQIAQTQANSVGYRAPSYGLFKTSLTPEYWYGIPRNVKADGLGMDVDRFINLRVDKENNQENWRAFNRAQGARMSAMEHLVPEQMFSTEEAPANGISAVKAIQLAAAEGQKIYTITQQNLSVALQQIQLSSEIKADIRNAVSAGMEVTTHQQPVNFFGSQSVGYILLDPNTGAGAYRISDGDNGALLVLAGIMLLILAAMNPGLGIFLAAAAISIIGCGVSRIFSDSRYASIGFLISSLVLGWISRIASAGGAILARFVVAIDVVIIIADYPAECAGNR
jgi:hypothetical protein